MIASIAAVGLGPGLGTSSGNRGVPVEEGSPEAAVTPTGLKSFPDGPALTIDATKPHKATIKTNKGTIEIALNTDAPEAVNSFAFLAGHRFYNGTVFFYVNEDFVAQAGDPTCDIEGKNLCTGVGSPGYSLPVEQTKANHEQWAVVAPAVIEGQEVHGSQFRILLNPDPRLDGKETVFGKVTAGQNILESLSNFVPCSVQDTAGCQPKLDDTSALVIEAVVVEPA